jgi:hypothetical protein
MALVNGEEYSWVKIRASIAGIPVFGVEGITYGIKSDKKNNYGIGSLPVSRSYGIDEFDGSIELHMSEVEAFTNVAPNRDITKIPPFDLTVVFLGKGAPVTHVLQDVEFMENGRDMKLGDEVIKVKLPLIIGYIKF